MLKKTLLTGLFLFVLNEAAEAAIIHGDNVQKHYDFAKSDQRFTYTTKLNLWKPTNGFDENGKEKFSLCSGTALWDWVITSAHCVYKDSSDEKGIMGTATLQYRGLSEPKTLKIVSKIVPTKWKNPDKENDYSSTPFDIALLKLEKPVPKLKGVEFFPVNGLPPLSALGFDGAFAGYGYLKTALEPVTNPEKPGIPKEAVAITNRYQTLPIARGVLGDDLSETLFDRLSKVYWSDLDSGKSLDSPDFNNTLTPYEGISNSGDSGAGVFNGNILTAINSRRDDSYKACSFNQSGSVCKKPANRFTYGVVNYATPVVPYLSGIFKKIDELKNATLATKTKKVNVSRTRANNNDIVSKFDEGESFEEPEVLEVIEGIDLGDLEIIEEDYQRVLNELLMHYDEVYKNLDNGGNNGDNNGEGNNGGDTQKVPEPTALLGFTLLGVGGVIKKLLSNKPIRFS